MAADSEFTIDQLARAADITVRSVRVYHERGLLPSPEVRGRIGYYRPDHLDRLQTISRLLGRGMKLNGIRELLDAWDRGEGLADVLGVSEDEVAAPLPAPGDGHPLDAYRTANPRCFELATQLTDSGLTAQDTFGLIERLRADCERLAERYAAELFERTAGDADTTAAPTPEQQAVHATRLAAARLLLNQAATELLDQAFDKHTPPAP